jgi:hypothetical protein
MSQIGSERINETVWRGVKYIEVNFSLSVLVSQHGPQRDE